MRSVTIERDPASPQLASGSSRPATVAGDSFYGVARTTAVPLSAFLLSVCVLLQCNGAAAQNRPAATTSYAVETLKERLSDKASDQQRVNDCNVPPEKRGDSSRPAECGPPDDGTPDANAITAPSETSD